MTGRIEGGAVAAGHKLTVKAARHALEEGGNATDAACAAAWMACVVEPVLASPGGGGFAMVTEDGAEPQLCDFFAQTPKHPNPDADFHAIEADFGTTTQTFHIGPGSTATPGFVPGLFALHERHGRLPMARLIAPAATIARRGHTVNAFQARLARIISPILLASEGTRALFAPSGDLLSEGEMPTNPDLARFLEGLAEGGLDWYMAKAVPRMLAMQHGEGHLQQDDFEDYAPQWRTPLRETAGDGLVWLNPPPAASGLMIALANREAERRASSGENDTCTPCDWAAALDLADRARRESGHDLDALAMHLGPPSTRGTTHISVIDGRGGACALTVSNGEGNGHVVPGLGFMPNNMLGEEDVNPAGRSGWPADTRLSSMMAPTIARREDGMLHVLGSGGSNRIRSVILIVLRRLMALRQPLAAAVEAPRLHVEDGHLDFEPGFSGEEAAALARMFPDHRAWTEHSMFFGGCHAVSRHPDGTMEAHGDPRRAGAAGIIR